MGRGKRPEDASPGRRRRLPPVEGMTRRQLATRLAVEQYQEAKAPKALLSPMEHKIGGIHVPPKFPERRHPRPVELPRAAGKGVSIEGRHLGLVDVVVLGEMLKGDPTITSLSLKQAVVDHAVASSLEQLIMRTRSVTSIDLTGARTSDCIKRRLEAAAESNAKTLEEVAARRQQLCARSEYERWLNARVAQRWELEHRELHERRDVEQEQGVCVQLLLKRAAEEHSRIQKRLAWKVKQEIVRRKMEDAVLCEQHGREIIARQEARGTLLLLLRNEEVLRQLICGEMDEQVGRLWLEKRRGWSEAAVKERERIGQERGDQVRLQSCWESARAEVVKDEEAAWKDILQHSEECAAVLEGLEAARQGIVLIEDHRRGQTLKDEVIGFAHILESWTWLWKKLEHQFQRMLVDLDLAQDKARLSMEEEAHAIFRVLHDIKRLVVNLQEKISQLDLMELELNTTLNRAPVVSVATRSDPTLFVCPSEGGVPVDHELSVELALEGVLEDTYSQLQLLKQELVKAGKDTLLFHERKMQEHAEVVRLSGLSVAAKLLLSEELTSTLSAQVQRCSSTLSYNDLKDCKLAFWGGRVEVTIGSMWEGSEEVRGEPGRLQEEDGMWTMALPCSKKGVSSLNEALRGLLYVCTLPVHGPPVVRWIVLLVHLRQPQLLHHAALPMTDADTTPPLQRDPLVIEIRCPVVVTAPHIILKSQHLRYGTEEMPEGGPLELFSGAVLRNPFSASRQKETVVIEDLPAASCFKGFVLEIRFSSALAQDGLVWKGQQDTQLIYDDAEGTIRHYETVIAKVEDGCLSTVEGKSTLQRGFLVLRLYDCSPNLAMSVLQSIHYLNSSSEIITGVRELRVSTTDSTGLSSTTKLTISVEHIERPTEVILARTKVLYHELVTKATPHDHRHLLRRACKCGSVPLFAGCLVRDVDIDHFKGGHVEVSIVSGYAVGDRLHVADMDEGTGTVVEDGERWVTFEAKKIGQLVQSHGRARPNNLALAAKKSQGNPPKVKRKSQYTIALLAKSLKGAAKRRKFWRLLFTMVLAASRIFRTTESVRHLKLSFTADGSASIAAVGSFLRCVCFSSSRDGIGREGPRTVEVVVNVGTGVKGAPDECPPSPREAIVRQVVVKPTPPLITAHKKVNTVRYTEGSAPIRLAPFEIVPDVDLWEGAQLRVEVVRGFRVGEDVLTLAERDGLRLDCGHRKLEKGEHLVRFKERVKEVGVGTVVTGCLTEAARSKSKPHTQATPPALHCAVIGALVITAALTERHVGDEPSESHEEKARRRSTRSNFPRASLAAYKFNKVKGLLMAKTERSMSSKRILMHVANQLVRPSLQIQRMGIDPRFLKPDMFYEITIDGREVGSVLVGDGGHLHFYLCKRCPVRRKDVQTILRNVTYANCSQNPVGSPRTVLVTAEQNYVTVGAAAVSLDVELVDDTTVVHLLDDKLTYRPGICEELHPFCIAPLDLCFLEDPDTMWFDSGVISVELVSGGHRGDSFGILDCKQQMKAIDEARSTTTGTSHFFTWLRISDPAEFLFDITPDHKLVLRKTKTSFANVVWPRAKSSQGGADIKILLKRPDANGKCSVSIHLVQYVLNCIYYTNRSDKIKPVLSTFLIRVGDGKNPKEGKAKIYLDLQPALLTFPSGYKTELSGRPGDSVSPLAKAVVNIPGDAVLASGFVTVTASSDSDLIHPRLNLPLKDLNMFVKEGCVYQGLQLIAGVRRFAEDTIDLDFRWGSKCTGPTLQTLLRAVVVHTDLIPGVITVKVSACTGRQQRPCELTAAISTL